MCCPVLTFKSFNIWFLWFYISYFGILFLFILLSHCKKAVFFPQISLQFVSGYCLALLFMHRPTTKRIHEPGLEIFPGSSSRVHQIYHLLWIIFSKLRSPHVIHKQKIPKKSFWQINLLVPSLLFLSIEVICPDGCSVSHIPPSPLCLSTI